MDLEGIVAKFKVRETGGIGGVLEHPVPPDVLLEYAQQMQNIFSGSPSSSKLDYYLGLAFPESSLNEGLLAFLRKTITEKTYDKVKENAFNLIQYVLVQKAWRSDVNRFCIRFKITANTYWKHSKVSARLQQAALDCLIALFENFGTDIDLMEFEASQLFLELLPLSEKSKFQPTVRGKMFHLLGVLGTLGKNVFMNARLGEDYFTKVFNLITATVQSQIESSDAHLEVSILLGCLKGLNQLLSVYDAEIDEGGNSWIRFQEHLERIVDPFTSIVKSDGKAKIKRREFQRAALELIANHGSLLKVGLFKKHRQWFEDLIEWSKSPNADDNRVGRRAMYKYLDTVIGYAKQIKESDTEEMYYFSKPDVENFLKVFSKRFKNVLITKDANRIELGIAVRGYGMLSNICSDKSQTQEMLNLIMEHVGIIIQELDSPTVDKYSASLSILTTYLESVASLLPALKTDSGQINLTQDHLDSMKRLTIILIRFFPELNESRRSVCHISVRKVFESLWTHYHDQCEPFIEHVYRQSLLHIVSGPTRAEIDILIESFNRSNPNSKRSPFKELGLKPITFYTGFFKQLVGRTVMNDDDSTSLSFDLLMQWVLLTIEKLDLTIKEDNEISESILDPVQGAAATVVKDFQIFVNIVDFFQELFNTDNKTIHQQFEKWVAVYAEQMLVYITSHSYVSGFYKILAVVFDTARRIKYFEKSNQERSSLRDRLNFFFRRLGTKIKEFRDDLLFAVLELWLSLPDTLILSNFSPLDNTLQTVFTTGRNSFALAIKGLEAMERWFFKAEFPAEEIYTIINNVYPILKTYFIHSETLIESEAEPLTKTKTSGKGGLKNLIKKKIQSQKSSAEDATLKATQLKILELISHFGQYIQLSNMEHVGLRKDSRYLVYEIPLQDCKAELFIDDLLPRVLELCENAVERQTRISACEFFHTLTLIFIGRSKEAVQENERKEPLFKKIFESMLKLGCDSDVVVRQLFNPLCLQTIHWFSKRNSPYAALLLEILIKNLTQHQDLTLRELAALCIGEYFQWCIRHSFSSQNKAVLKTIFALSTHASVDFRQGSVLAFSSIYRDFREDRSLISEFSFNLMYSFLSSLKLSKDLPDDSLLVTSTLQSIKHLEKIIVKKKDLFNTALHGRRFKPTTSNTTIPCLKDVLGWLLQQGGNPAPIYRKECLRLVAALSPYEKDIKSVERCLTVFENNGSDDVWIQIAEASLPTSSTNESNPNGITLVSSKQLCYLDASSEFYNFLFEYNMLRKTVFSPGSRSQFLKYLMAVCSYLQPIAACQLSEDEKICVLNVFSRLKFVWKVVNEENLSNLWRCSMELSQNMGTLHSSSLIEDLVKVWGFEVAPETMLIKCRPLLTFKPDENLREPGNEHASLVLSLNQSDWFRIAADAENGILIRILSKDSIEELKVKLWRTINAGLFKNTTGSTEMSSSTVYVKNLAPTESKILENYLIIAIEIGLSHKLIVDAIFDATTATQQDGAFQVVTTKGSVLQKQLMNALVYCDSLFNFDVLLKERSIRDVGEMIQRLLELMKNKKHVRQKFGKAVFEKCISNWRMISVNCDMPTSVKIFVGLVAVNGDGCKDSNELAEWWYGKDLMLARHLDLKQKTGVFGYGSVFVRSKHKHIVEAVINTITSFIENDLRPESINWTDVEQHVIHIAMKLLQVWEQLPLNLNILFPILCLTQKVSTWLMDNSPHLIFKMVQTSLEKVSTLYANVSERVQMASKLYEHITSVEVRKKPFTEFAPIWKSTLLPVVSSFDEETTKIFFSKHIYSVITSMEMQPSSLYDWHKKTLAVNLLELMIYKTSGHFIKGEKDNNEIGEKDIIDTHTISTAYWDAAPPEKKINQDLTDPKTVYRRMVRVCIDGIMNGCKLSPTATVAEEENLSLKQCRLKSVEACYNTLVATLLETKAEYKFFNKFLFPGKKIFENITDNERIYNIPVVIDGEQRQKYLFNRRKMKRGPDTSGNHEVINLIPKSGNLTGSSLEPEAANYDFTCYSVVNSDFYQKILGTVQNNPPSSISESSSLDSEIQDQNDNRLEWNEINEHRCMFGFVETLKFLAGLHRAQKDDGKPQWPTTIATVLNDNKVHNNVKLFIVGGIINTPDYLKPFAAELVEPIVQSILSDCFGSIGMNHFVQDIIITLLSWNAVENSKPKPETVTELIKYIVNHVSRNEEIYKRKDVFLHVMEILQNVVQHWVGNISEIPGQAIDSLVSTNQLTEEVSGVMLNVSLSVLLGGRLPDTNTCALFKKYLKASSSKFKGVYVTAGKCLGVILHKSKTEAPEDVHEKFVADVVNRLKKSSSDSKASVFVDLLSAVQQSFPEMIFRVRDTIMQLCRNQQIRSDILSLFPLLLKEEVNRSHSMAECDFNEDVAIAISPQKVCGDEFYADIRGRGFFDLNHPCKSENDLISALNLLEILIENTSEKTDLLDVVNWMKNCAEVSLNSEIKVKFAKCLQKLYGKLLNDTMVISTLDENSLDPAKRQIFFRIFIRIYEDENEEVQEVVHQFWQTVLHRWTQSSAHLLIELFDLIGEEQNPLNICLGIILQRCSLAPDYEELIFRDPLENCDFLPFQLDTSWRLRHSSFQPLFSESLSTAKNFTALPRTLQSTLLSQRRNVGKFGMNVLQATLANLQFTPTQQNEEVEKVVQVDNYTQNFQPADSSLNVPGNQEHHHNMQQPTQEHSSSPVLKLRKKFYTRKESSFYAAKESEKQAERKEEDKETKLAKISGVKTVRTYRIGELPDIAIHHSDVLQTLLKLAKLDGRIGQQLIFHLYNGMAKTMDSNDSRRFLSKSKEIFDRVLRNSASSSDLSLSSLLIEISVSSNIQVPLNILLDVCKLTDTQKLGILKLEKQLMNENDSMIEFSTAGQKRIKLPNIPNSQEVDIWLGLAEMYKGIEEFDGLRNVFAKVHDCPFIRENRKELYANIGEALEWEGKGYLEKALNLFDNALNDDNLDDGQNTTTKYFLEDSILNCLTKLGDWSTLFESTQSFNMNLTGDVLQDNNAVDRLIPFQMLSGMHLTLRHEDNKDSEEEEELDEEGSGRKEPTEMEALATKFNEFIVNTLASEEGTNFLSIRYPFDAAAWFLIDPETEEEYTPYASLMLERGYEMAINQFKKLDGFSIASQKRLLVTLQQSAVVAEYLKWKKPYRDFAIIEERTMQLLSNWKKHLAFQPMDLVGSDIVSAHRDQFISKIGIHIEDAKPDCSELLISIQKLRVEQDIWLADLGTLHRNRSISQNCLRRLKESRREHLLLVEFRKSFARFLTTFASFIPRDEWCQQWCGVWKTLRKISGENEQLGVNEIKADLLHCVLEFTEQDVQSDYGLIIKTVAGTQRSYDLNTCISKAVEDLINTCGSVVSLTADEPNSRNACLFAKLFHLLKKLSKNFSETNTGSAEKLLVCLLRGCSEGGSNEMMMLSNIFSLLKKFPNSLGATFQETVKHHIPSYLFLPWIDQIVTTYKSSPDKYFFLKDVIDRLILDYPQAFQIQYSEFLSDGNKLFAKALKSVVLPYKLHENHVIKILRSKNQDEIIKHLDAFQASLQEIINNINQIYGELHSNYATDMFEVVNKYLMDFQRREDSELSDDLPLHLIQDCQRTILKVDNNHKQTIDKIVTIKLEGLSPFLADFHFFEHDSIEKPGLYEIFRPPKVNYHPLIVSFHPTLHRYASLTKPLKLTMLTNDGKKSNFLAKLGDDLRQDRRIQQLFKVANELLTKDARASQKNLSLQTYSCIPITEDFGIIEMVEDVMSLSDLILERQEIRTLRGETLAEYEKWIKITSGLSAEEINRGGYSYYKYCARNARRDDATNSFNRISSKIPNSIFRDNFQQRSNSLQDYFNVRQTTIKSYGAMCMIHWMLGIGDRHLENCLLSMSTGKLVGIDFGRAFGISNYGIPVPELVPFRLTPQIQHLMLPYGFQGLFRESCVLTWTCLEGVAELILTVADVFIQEPSIEWLKQRRNLKAGTKGEQDISNKSEENLNDNQNQQSTIDFPFEIMKRKLQNHNPTILLLEELKRHFTKDIYGMYMNIVANGRLHSGKEIVSTEEHVDILLDLATDKNILHCVYSGWSSWI